MYDDFCHYQCQSISIEALPELSNFIGAISSDFSPLVRICAVGAMIERLEPLLQMPGLSLTKTLAVAILTHKSFLVPVNSISCLIPLTVGVSVSLTHCTTMRVEKGWIAILLQGDSRAFLGRLVGHS